MNVKIRRETQNDHEIVFELVKGAFANEAYSDHSEHFLVERLRQSEAFIPGLSMVAELDNRVVGYILLTKIQIKNDQKSFDSLALAPVAVLPEYQGKGIGGQLITEAHEQARALGFRSIVLLGHQHYYPRFGYKRSSEYSIRLPFEAPEENCMVLELLEGGLNGVSGTVVYAKEFGI